MVLELRTLPLYNFFRPFFLKHCGHPNKGDWVRLSFCLQGFEPIWPIYAQEHYVNNEGSKSYRDRPASRTPLREVDSIDALEAYMDGPRPGLYIVLSAIG